MAHTTRVLTQLPAQLPSRVLLCHLRARPWGPGPVPHLSPCGTLDPYPGQPIRNHDKPSISVSLASITGVERL